MAMQIPRQQRFNLVHRLRQRQAAHDAAQPCVWLQAVRLSRFHQGVNDGAGVGTGRRVTEQPSLAADHKGADGVLAPVMPTLGLCRIMIAGFPVLGRL